uniref:NADH dehydrogenase subunit 6 n=1 Tax=Quadraceps sp. SLC-2011 TaxID=1075160 RepID=G1EN51_9NEOP|nr:NADH dehydrogenase subunit 6 [Quadraceps sp. SLC-2011]
MAYVTKRYSEDVMKSLTFGGLILNISCVIFLSLFWMSEAPSFALVFSVIFLTSMAGKLFFMSGESLTILILLITMAGGLFVITSFVVFTCPNDFVSIFWEKKWVMMIFLLFGMTSHWLSHAENASEVLDLSQPFPSYLSVYMVSLVLLLGSLVMMNFSLVEKKEMFS